MSQKNLELYDNLLEQLTPSSLIDHIIEGIEHFKDHPTFAYDMITFGSSASDDYRKYYSKGDTEEDILCVGCLATSTIFKLMDEEPSPNNIHLKNHPTNGYTYESVKATEYAVNSIRCYNIPSFLIYFRVPRDIIIEITNSFSTYISDRHSLTINGHPKNGELDIFIKNMRILQQILKNHNL